MRGGSAPCQEWLKRGVFAACHSGVCDTAITERLSLTAGPNLYSYFHQTLNGEIRDEFDNIHPNHANTVDGFCAAVNELIAHYACLTNLADQQRYLETMKNQTQ